MRKKPTRSEALLWRALKRDGLGVHARRQHVLFPYIVDFYFATRRLAVEVDGSVQSSSASSSGL